jgi:hypothetical protein
MPVSVGGKVPGLPPPSLSPSSGKGGERNVVTAAPPNPRTWSCSGCDATNPVSTITCVFCTCLKISALKGLIKRNGGSYDDIDSTQSKRAVKAALTQRLREILDSSSPGSHYADEDVDKLVNDEVEVEVRVISTLNHTILEGVAAVGLADSDEAAVSSDSEDDSDSSADELDGSVDLSKVD